MTSTLAGQIKKWFISGLIVILPLLITLVVVRFLISVVTGFLLPILGFVLPQIPVWVKTAISLVLLALLITLLGLATGHFLGRWLLTRFEKIMMQIPLLRVIYGSSRDVIHIFKNAGEKTAFKQVVLVEFPGPGLYALAFVTGSIVDPKGRPCYTIFIPTTPNPSTGFLQIVEKTRVTHCEMTVEQGIKTIISVGMLGPETLSGTAPYVMPSEINGISPDVPESS